MEGCRLDGTIGANIVGTPIMLVLRGGFPVSAGSHALPAGRVMPRPRREATFLRPASTINETFALNYPIYGWTLFALLRANIGHYENRFWSIPVGLLNQNLLQTLAHEIQFHIIDDQGR
jgi:hypothetical protein